MDFKPFKVCMRSGMELLVVTLMAGCMREPRWIGVSAMAPLLDTPVAVRYLAPEALPRRLEQADFRALEALIGRIRGLGDPVVVSDVYLAWQNSNAAVLYRTERYDIYVVRDSRGRWLLSEITNVPVP